MPKVAKLVIDKNIGERDQYASVYGYDDPCFSSSHCREFIEANTDADEFEIEIRSNGGSTTQGFEIFDMLKTSGKKIKCIGYKVNSIATIIFLAGTERELSKNAEFIPHNPRIDFEALWGVTLTADELQSITDEVRQVEEKMFNTYVEVLGLDEAKQTELKELMAEDKDIGADKAYELGFATKLINTNSNVVEAKRVFITDRIAAIYLNKKTISDMEAKKINEKIDAIKASISAFFKANGHKEDGTKIIKASSETAEDGTKMYFSEEALANDIKVYSDEEMTTSVKDGEYKSGKKTFKVSAGEVKELKEEEEEEDVEDVEAKAQIKALEDKVKALENDLVTAKTKADATIKASTEEVKKIFDQVTALQKIVPGEGELGAGGKGAEGKSFAEVAKEESQNRRKLNF